MRVSLANPNNPHSLFTLQLTQRIPLRLSTKNSPLIVSFSPTPTLSPHHSPPPPQTPRRAVANSPGAGVIASVEASAGAPAGRPHDRPLTRAGAPAAPDSIYPNYRPLFARVPSRGRPLALLSFARRGTLYGPRLPRYVRAKSPLHGITSQTRYRGLNARRAGIYFCRAGA